MGNLVPLEDELGDVLEKAMRRAGLTEEALGNRASVAAGRIRDAVDYRSELTCDELRRLAPVLRLNEVGLCALGCGRYPLPDLVALPFCVYPLRMPHGIGVTNAYLVTPCGSSHGILFDTGSSMDALIKVWPRAVQSVDAVFLTHVEAEHAGGLCAVVERFAVPVAYCPMGATASCSEPIGEGKQFEFAGFKVRVFTTPGHASAHNCYLVESSSCPAGRAMLVSGDLFFAGSVGCAHFCARQLATNLRRMLEAIPADTLIAPGHGPMTTAENELRYNPFVI